MCHTVVAKETAQVAPVPVLHIIDSKVHKRHLGAAIEARVGVWWPGYEVGIGVVAVGHVVRKHEHSTGSR